MENFKNNFWFDTDRNALIVGNKVSAIIIGQDGLSFLDDGEEYTLDELIDSCKRRTRIVSENKSRMTNKEAIRRIEDHIEHHGIGQYPHIHIYEALQMAIVALRKEDDEGVQ